MSNDPRLGWTSASNAAYDAACPGRHLAQKGLPEVATEDASFGTQIHQALASGDESKLRSDQLSIFESCVEIREKLIVEKFGPDADKVERIIEQRFWWISDDKTIGHSGQVDLVARYGDIALLIDYKCLPGDQADSSENAQLRDLAALVAGNLKLSEVDVAIVQPLVTHSPGICRYDLNSISRSQSEMVDRVTASNTPESKRVASETACKYCLARFTCPEYSKLVEVSVPAAMSSLAIPVSMWSPEQRALFCERLSVAQKWLDECKAKIKELLKEDPAAVPGWKLEPGAIKRPVNNPNELHARFLANGGTAEQFLSMISVGKGDLEAGVRAATKLKGKALRAKLDEMLAGIVDEKRDESSLGVVK